MNNIKKTIIIIGNSEEFEETFLYSYKNFTIIECENNQNAYEYLLENDANLLILDCYRNREDSLSFVKILRDESNLIPIIMVCYYEQISKDDFLT